MARLREIKMFSDEQVERANRVDVVDYVRSLGYEIKRSGKWYKAKGQGGLYFYRPANTWHWETQADGGRGAISLCMKLEDKDWRDAVKTLLGEEMNAIRHTQDWKPEPEPPKEFKLPSQNDTYRHVFAYLIHTRGIDEKIVKDMVDKKLIYENTQRSCVFVGRDKDGIAKHASVRSTNTARKAFKQDVIGSQKAFSFSISGTSGTLNVFEAPIDVLSYMSLQKEHGLKNDDSYVALGGVTDKALQRFLEEYPDIKKIRICTDHDEAGEGAACRIYEKYHERFKITRHRPTHKDFNEDLVALKYPERTKAKKQDIEKEKEVQTDKRADQMQGNKELEKQAAEQSIASENDGQPHEQTTEKKADDSMQVLQQAGVSRKVITWYQNGPDVMPMSAEHFQIKGTSSTVFVCENPVEVFSVMELRMRIYQMKYGKDDYVANDNYLVYSGIHQFNQYMQEHPNITKVCLCGGQTAGGRRLNKEIAEGINCDKQIIPCEPEMNTYAELLAMQNAVKEVMKQTPANDQQCLEEMDMVMEM